MDVTAIINSIEQEISRLQQARIALAAIDGTQAPVVTRTRGPKKGTMSEAGRKRIAEAMKRRWAEKKAASSQKAAARKPAKKAAPAREG